MTQKLWPLTRVSCRKKMEQNKMHRLYPYKESIEIYKFLPVGAQKNQLIYFNDAHKAYAHK